MKVKFNEKRYLLEFLKFFMLFLCIFVTLLSIVAYSQIYDANLSWKVIESQHFNVIFPQLIFLDMPSNYQQIALHVLEIAEETYQQITPMFGKPYYMDKKITIILEDFKDSAYGFASSIPYPTIRLNLTSPGFKNFDTQFESWLKIVITHEYTHLIHFNMTNRGTDFLRFFLGQIITPNALQPLWAIEGLAIYNESKWTSGGRIEDSRYQMYLRSDFIENKVKTFDQLQGSYLVSWPGGNAPYIYGQSLIHFIAQKYGEEELINISREFCALPLLGMDHALKKIIGMDQKELFTTWKNEQTDLFRRQINELNQFAEITDSQQITNHQYWVDNPEWLNKDSDRSIATLIYKVNVPHLYPTVREYNPADKNEDILIKRAFGHGTSYGISPDHQFIIYSKLSKYQQYYQYNDLFLYHLRSGKQIKITEGMRLKDPSWRPNNPGNHIVAVLNHLGSNNLVAFPVESRFFKGGTSEEKVLLSFSELTYLSDFSNGAQISQPVWSPQGNQIAFSLWLDGYQNIYIITFDDQEHIQSITPVTADHHTNISPDWSEDGSYLFFSSDRTGIFNIYAYHLRDQQIVRLTNVISGAFEPAVSPDGKKLAFIQYHATGYELHVINMDNLLWKIADIPLADFSIPHPVILNNKIIFNHSKVDIDSQEKIALDSNKDKLPYTIKDYSPFDSLWPTYWIPFFSITSNDFYIGFSSLIQDQLEFYHVPFTLAYGLLNDSIYYDIQLIDHIHKPSFSFSWQGETSFSYSLQTSVNFNNQDYSSQQDTARFYTEDLMLGFQTEKYLLDDGLEKNMNGDNFRKVNSLILKYGYHDEEFYQSSISPEIGNHFTFSYQHANHLIGSDITFNKIYFDGRRYIPVSGKNQSLAFRLVAGMATENLDQYEKFHLGGSHANYHFGSAKTTSFPLRGFSDFSFSGSHLLVASLEYRFPIKNIEHKIGFKGASVFLERVSGALYLDAGHAWNDRLFPIPDEMNFSIGAELHFKLNQRYSNPFLFTIGVGKAVSQPEKLTVYGRLGISF